MPADGAGPGGKLAEKITNGGDTQDWACSGLIALPYS